MQITVIGSGSVGAGLARAWSAMGHSVVIGSRSPESERVIALVSKIGNGVEAAPVPDSVVGADVIVLAVPWSAAEESISSLGDVSGRVFVDATNPFSGGLNLSIGHTHSGGEQVAQWASGARVVKALNIVDARLLEGRQLDGMQISIPICGDDVDAKHIASKLISELGIDTSSFEISHVAFRTATFREYIAVRDRLEKSCSGNLENVWNGRPISKLLLKTPVGVDGGSVHLIELIPPFHQCVYPMGWEHVGYVVGDTVDEFGSQHRGVITLQQFQSPVCEPYVIRFEDYSHAKFYRWSLHDVCVKEGKHFDGFIHVDWAPDDDLAGPYPDL